MSTQTIYALVTQSLLLAYVASFTGSASSPSGSESGSFLCVGMVSVWCLTAYSVGRLLFFMVREDEVRRKPSYPNKGGMILYGTYDNVQYCSFLSSMKRVPLAGLIG